MKSILNTKLPNILFLICLHGMTAWVFYMAATREFHDVEGYGQVRMIMLVLLAPLLIKYVFQLGCTPIYSLAGKMRSKRHEEMPSVSVLVPAWNEEVGIVKTVQSVLDTAYPNVQLIVINDGSTDSTHDIMTTFVADHPLDDREGISLKYLNLSNGGKAKALNRGLLHADGEIVITVDADSIMDRDAITNLVKQFTKPDIGAVAGNVVIANRAKPLEWIQQLEYVYGFFFKRADSLFNSVYIIGGAAAAYRRDVLHRVGGFDHAIITEDIEMSTRILSHGYKTRYASDAVVYTEGPSELQGLCNQRLRWKHGRILTFAKHRKLFFSMRPGHNPYLTWFLLPIAVYAELLLLAEAVLLSSFFVYTVATSDYMPLVFVITLLSAVVSAQVLVDPRRRFHRNLFFLIPSAWLVFYALDLVEFQALIRSVRRLVLRKDLKWQKWKRVGVLTEARALVGRN